MTRGRTPRGAYPRRASCRQRGGDQPGPLQLNGMCLLDCPLRSHLNPNASARSTCDFPHVATALGPTSEPGGFNVCTRCPGNVVGPVSASAFASTLPGI